MKLLCYADVQATDGSERCFGDPSVPLQQWRVVRFYERLLAVYTEHQCDGLVDLGDTTDDRSSIPMPTIDAVIGGLEQFPDSDYHFKIIGNHEQYLRNTQVNVGRMFSAKFTVIANTGVVEHDNLAMLFCSFPADHDALAKVIKSTAYEYRNKKLAMFGHFQAVGARMGSGEALTGIPKSVLKPFHVGMLGHIHIPQTVLGNIHYVGSPFQQDFGEADEDKRVGIVDTDTLKVTWVPLEDFPRYYRVGLDEFEKSMAVDGASEDRFQVCLHNQEEATRYFQHPQAHRAQATYQYDVKETEKQEVSDGSWSFDSVLKRYLNRVPPSAAGIEHTSEEMLEFGIQITT